MKRVYIINVLLLGFFLSGCSKQSSVICFAPVEPYKPQSGAELLEEFNSHLPFKVSPKHFVCKYKTSRLVGWAIVRTSKQKDIIKQMLSESSALTLLQVESLTPELKALFKKEWKQSQSVTRPIM